VFGTFFAVSGSLTALKLGKDRGWAIAASVISISEAVVLGLLLVLPLGF
jgi:hypothetical protein